MVQKRKEVRQKFLFVITVTGAQGEGEEAHEHEEECLRAEAEAKCFAEERAWEVWGAPSRRHKAWVRTEGQWR